MNEKELKREQCQNAGKLGGRPPGWRKRVFSSDDVANLFGVKPATARRWFSKGGRFFGSPLASVVYAFIDQMVRKPLSPLEAEELLSLRHRLLDLIVPSGLHDIRRLIELERRNAPVPVMEGHVRRWPTV